MPYALLRASMLLLPLSAAAQLPDTLRLEDRDLRYQEAARQAAAQSRELGDLGEAERQLRSATRALPASDTTWYDLACTQALRGKRDAAFYSLERAKAAGWADPIHPAEDPDLAGLREDPRFASWLVGVRENLAASSRWPSPDPPSAIAELTAAEVERLAGQAQASIEGAGMALSPATFLRWSRHVIAWKAVALDALAQTAAPSEAEKLRLAAVTSITGACAISLDDVAAGEALRRLEALRLSSRTLDSGAISLMNQLEAESRYSRDLWAAPERREALRLRLERELLVVAATAAACEANTHCLLHVLSWSGDDGPTRRMLVDRLRSIEPDDSRLRSRLGDSGALGAYYREVGLPDCDLPLLGGGRFTSPGSPDGPLNLVYVWAPWCGPCKALSPMLRDLSARFSPDRLRIIGVMADASAFKDTEALAAWRRERQISWPEIIDGPGLARRLGVRSLPALLLARPDGKVLAAENDLLPREQLVATVERMLEAGSDTSGTR